MTQAILLSRDNEVFKAEVRNISDAELEAATPGDDVVIDVEYSTLNYKDGLAITGSSWLFLGLIVGMLGYCPLTDWHFNILYKLGRADLPTSYIKYLADRLTGLDIDQTLVDNATLYGFIIALAISLLLNFMEYRKRRLTKEP